MKETAPSQEVIAERALLIDGLRGKHVVVRLGRPYPVFDGAEYRCPYQISGLGTEISRYGAGIDAFQSIRLALRLIGAEIFRMNKDVRLTWVEGADAPNCGFDEMELPE